jgi:hypothetical protein
VTIPRSTVSTWRRRGSRPVITIEPIDQDRQQLVDTIAKLDRRVRILAAVVRVLLAMLRASGFTLAGERLPEGAAKAGILRAITSAKAFLLQIELHQLELRYQALRAAEPLRRRKLLSALCETGQQVPVIVVAATVSETMPARYVLIDGYLRVDILRSLGRDVVEATVWTLGETEALIARFHLEGHARSTLEEAWLIEHLAKDDGLSLEELGRRLCRTKSWVSRRPGLRKVLWPEVQAKVASGKIPPQAAMKYLLPLARANGDVRPAWAQNKEVTS